MMTFLHLAVLCFYSVQSESISRQTKIRSRKCDLQLIVLRDLINTCFLNFNQSNFINQLMEGR